MEDVQSTCWTLIHGAARGVGKEREGFVGRYIPVIRAYLAARWRSKKHLAEIDDAVQEVFFECFRRGGALDRVDSSRGGGFRAFLYGVVRNVALRTESRLAQARETRESSGIELDGLGGSEEDLARTFDRTWAEALLKEAAGLQIAKAREKSPDASRRVEILRLRFEESLPIREIAKLWNREPRELHQEYAQARIEFKEALLEVIRFHHPSSTAGEAERECVELLDLLS